MTPLPFKVDWAPSFPSARKKIGSLAPTSIHEVLAQRKFTRFAMALLIVPAYFLGVAILLHCFWTPSAAQITTKNPSAQSTTAGPLALGETSPGMSGLKESGSIPGEH
jgi:hypothetical protein